LRVEVGNIRGTEAIYKVRLTDFKVTKSDGKFMLYHPLMQYPEDNDPIYSLEGLDKKVNSIHEINEETMAGHKTITEPDFSKNVVVGAMPLEYLRLCGIGKDCYVATLFNFHPFLIPINYVGNNFLTETIFAREDIGDEEMLRRI